MSELLSLSINPNEAIIYLGGQIYYEALALYSDNSVVDVTTSTTWAISGSPSIGEFRGEENGLLLSKGIGDSTIAATYEGVTETTTLIIHNPLIVAQADDLVGAYRPSVDNYLNLLTSQYQNSPRLLAWVRSYLEIVEDIRELAENLSYYFSLWRVITPKSVAYVNQALTVKDGDFDFVEFEACVGVQLDILGVILGQSRKVDFIPTGGISSTLDDDTYRLLLKSKILKNQWDGRAATIQEAWKDLFTGGKIIIQDNQNMTVAVTMEGAFSSIILDLIANGYIIPRPQGVLMSYYYGTLPFFGFDRQDDYVAGFDTGNWI